MNARGATCRMILLTGLLVNEFSLSPRSSSLLLSKRSDLKADIELAQKINAVVPEGSRVYLFTDVKLYYLCHFKPAVPEKYGFAWNHMTLKADLDEILNNSAYAIVQKDNLEKLYELKNEKIDLYKKGAIDEDKVYATLNSYTGLLVHANEHKFSEDLKNMVWFRMKE